MRRRASLLRPLRPVRRTRSEGCSGERPWCAADRRKQDWTEETRTGGLGGYKALEESPLTAIPSHIRSLCEGWRSRVGDGVSWTICAYH